MTPSCSSADALLRNSGRRQILTAQVRLLYNHANVGVGITLIATVVLGRLQWEVVPHLIILGWCLYMFLVSVGRFTLGRLYWRTAPSSVETNRWGAAFTIGVGLAGAGWGAAGILLYQEARLANQVLLVERLAIRAEHHAQNDVTVAAQGLPEPLRISCTMTPIERLCCNL